MIYAYHSPYINTSSPKTYRIGSDDPEPVQVTSGFDNNVCYAFRDEQQKPWNTDNRNIKASIYNFEGTQLLEKSMTTNAYIRSVACLRLTSFDTKILSPGLYRLIITFDNNIQQREAVITFRNTSHFTLNVVDPTVLA